MNLTEDSVLTCLASISLSLHIQPDPNWATIRDDLEVALLAEAPPDLQLWQWRWLRRSLLDAPQYLHEIPGNIAAPPDLLAQLNPCALTAALEIVQAHLHGPALLA